MKIRYIKQNTSAVGETIGKVYEIVGKDEDGEHYFLDDVGSKNFNFYYYPDSWEYVEYNEDTSPLNKQVSGTHYKDCGIQPIEYIHANGLNYFEGNAVKYITRHRKKNGKADIEKAIHYLELMLELEYKENK